MITVGAQWGDEGKGKIVDLLAEQFDIIARYQGGHNAGHTVEIGDKHFVLQLVPCGLFRQGKRGVIGNGVVVDPAALLKEVAALEENGVPIWDRLLISSRAHLIFPFHRHIEKALESASKRASIGTTSRGIGPAYEDKAGRRGVRMGDIFDETNFRCLVETAVDEKQTILSQLGSDVTLDREEIVADYVTMCSRLKPLITDTAAFLNRELDNGRSVLFEGAQGTLLDLDHGTYPFVTSSSAAAGGACTGTGVGPTRISGVTGVSKAYTTRVGAGPFPTEERGAIGELLRGRGKEYGAVTGRSRRCGWIDLPILRYTAMLNGMDSLIVTKLDILDTLDEIPVCVAYELDGERLDEIPSLTDALAQMKPVYESLPGWQQSTFGLQRYDQLPTNARRYLEFIGSRLGLEIAMISTGPERAQCITVPGTRFEKSLPKPLGAR